MKAEELVNILDDIVYKYDIYKKYPGRDKWDRTQEIAQIEVSKESRDLIHEAANDIRRRYMSGSRTDVGWPENILSEIVTDIIAPLTEEQDEGLKQAIETLTEREQKVLKFRYIDGLSLEKTGKEFGVTRERIRQVEAKAIRKLHHPSRIKLIECGPSALDELTTLQKQLDKTKAELQREILKKRQELRDLQKGDPDTVKAILSTNGNLDTRLERMGLSVRAYNCCVRAGYKSADEFIGKTRSDLMKIRNLGRKSMEELIVRLAECGVQIEEESKK